MTSEIKVNKVSDSCGSALVTKCGSTITLGASGKTVAIASGASTSGMGRTGTVDWCTTIYTNSPGTVTGVSGKGYFLNTTSGAITINLPSSPSVGDIIAVKDYANTFDSNNVTIGRGGSKINGVCEDSVLSTESQSVTLIYVDSTKGWQDIHDSTSNVTGAPAYIVATGGNTTITCGDYKTHVFTADGTLSVTNGGKPSGSTILEYLVVAGGGPSGSPTEGSAYSAGGGGGGGFRMFTTAPGTNSPLIAPAGLTATAQSYPITVGAAGAFPANGTNSVFSTITSAGGGTGGRDNNNSPQTNGTAGGSGGGGGGYCSSGGAGNTPPVSPPQGNAGGNGSGGSNTGAGGGGGAGGTGSNGSASTGAKGGVGSYIANPFFGPTAPSYGTSGPQSSTRYFSGGGGGGAGYPGGNGSGGAAPDGGGGGAGEGAGAGTAGTTNTGGGGGGGKGGTGSATNGGSGFIAIRYKFQ
tara:strand:- start:76 stop:1476 length:1401 start_codon:yes stop_codon:yes gene_type:complete